MSKFNYKKYWRKIILYIWRLNITDFYHTMKNILWCRYDLIRTNCSKIEYHDKCDLMLYDIMNLIVEFVELEKCFEVINFDLDKHFKKIKCDIIEIYDWWKNYPEREKEIDNALHTWFNESILVDTDMKSDIELLQYDITLKTLEAKLYQEEQKMLHKVINIRNYLWT